MTTEELGERAKRVVNKLGSHEFDKVKKQYSELVASKSQKCGSLINGTIMGLINQNLTNREIRRVFSVGNNRINRIRKVIKNPAQTA